MVRNILGILFVFIIVNVNGNKHQDSIEAERKYKKIDPIMDQPALIIGFTHPGLFLFRASIAVGGLTKLNAGTVFFEGNTEYFIDRRVSLRGDVYFFGGHTGDYKPFKMHHSLLTGAMFHKYTKGDFDPYAGIEVGINYAQATDPYLGGTGSLLVPVESVSKVLSPTFSPVVGFNYYGGKFFHLSMHARYIMGTFMDNYNVASLGEWRISFGLGFNLSKKLIARDTSTAYHL
jgi:hypothetical protein